MAIAGEFYRRLVSSHEDDPRDAKLILGRLVSDQVSAVAPEVKIVAAGDPAITIGCWRGYPHYPAL
jgi:hypothetical protein